MAASRTPARRRQRSVRVTVAVSLLSAGTAAVLVALPTQSPVLLSAGAVAAIVLAWAALRMMWTEVLQSRRESAAERAATASAYKSLFSLRAAEHAEFTTAMTERLAESHQSVHELQGELVLAQRQAATMQRQAATMQRQAAKLQREAEQAQAKAVAAEEALEHLRAEREAEEADALASWEAEGGEPGRGTVEELVSWEARAAEIRAEQDEMTEAVKRA